MVLYPYLSRWPPSHLARSFYHEVFIFSKSAGICFLHWWKNEVARATSKMAEYIEVLHGSVKEGGGVKCIKRGEIPYCTFTLTYCIVGPKTQKARQKDIPTPLKVSGS